MNVTGALSPRRTRMVLIVIALALMTVVSAVSGLNTALPSLARDTGATQTQLTWIVDAYTVAFAGLLLFAGALGDRYGRKGLLMAGLIIFGAAAAAATTTSDPQLLIGLRAAMGVGAAAIMPTTLSVITTSFPEEERPRAIGLWVGVAGGGAVIGLFGTAVLLKFFAWNSFFALNVFLATLALAGTIATVPRSVDDHPSPLDLPGAALSLLAVAGVVFGIIEGPERGWTDPTTIIALVAGVSAVLAFVTWELHTRHPLLDPRLFRRPGFSGGSLSITVQFFAAFGFFFITLQYLQFVQGYSALRAAAALLPLPLVLIPLARTTPVIAGRFGFARVGPMGLGLMAVGFAVFSQLGVSMTYWQFAAGLVVFAAGMALAATPATTTITASLPLDKQGVASAVNDTSRELGSALGIALLGSILNQQYRSGMSDAVSGLPAEAASHIKNSIAFTQSPALARLGSAGSRLVEQGREAFVSGAQVAFLTCAAILAVATVAVAVLASRRDERPPAQPINAGQTIEGRAIDDRAIEDRAVNADLIGLRTR